MLIYFMLYKFRTHIKNLKAINIRIETKYLSFKAVEEKNSDEKNSARTKHDGEK